MDNLYLQHCQELRDLYQKQIRYPITENIQQLDFQIDIETLRQEIFRIISKNNYGYRTVSLRMPSDNTDWTDDMERVETGGITPTYFDDRVELQEDDQSNYRPNDEYTQWHPDVSFIKGMVEDIESHVGFKIGRVRLGWMMPNYGYTLHSDFEPMRLHIPIVTNKHAWFIHDEKIYTMEYGKLYHLITTGPHTAHNYGTLPRLHMILSTYGSADISQKIHELRRPEKSISNLKQELNGYGIDSRSLALLSQIEKNEPTVGAETMLEINKLLKEK